MDGRCQGWLEAGQDHAAACVWYQLAGTGSGGSVNVLLRAYGRIPVGEKKTNYFSKTYCIAYTRISGNQKCGSVYTIKWYLINSMFNLC